MTDEMMSLRALIEKAPDADFLREMIGFAAQRLMELEVGELTGAAYGEKSVERLAQRNGYRERPACPLCCLAATKMAGQRVTRRRTRAGSMGLIELRTQPLGSRHPPNEGARTQL